MKFCLKTLGNIHVSIREPSDGYISLGNPRAVLYRENPNRTPAFAESATYHYDFKYHSAPRGHQLEDKFSIWAVAKHIRIERQPAFNWCDFVVTSVQGNLYNCDTKYRGYDYQSTVEPIWLRYMNSEGCWDTLKEVPLYADMLNAKTQKRLQEQEDCVYILCFLPKLVKKGSSNKHELFIFKYSSVDPSKVPSGNSGKVEVDMKTGMQLERLPNPMSSSSKRFKKNPPKGRMYSDDQTGAKRKQPDWNASDGTESTVAGRPASETAPVEKVSIPKT